VDRLTAAAIWEELEGVPLMEAGTAEVIVPKKGGVIREDGSVKVAIIRPCVSKGRKIRGLPPIYTPAALAESAAVFTGWPMYEDHLVEEVVEQMAEVLKEAGHQELLTLLQERARSIRELGGRVVKSHYDPELTLPGDEENGYQKGGVVGDVVPQPRIKSMLEADPEILSVSINAWPSGAKPGTAPWNQSIRGMLIEGISPKPPGSVDWVFAPGAGGRPLLAESMEAELAVSLLESAYSAGAAEDDVDKLKEKLTQAKSQDELRSLLETEAPHLVEVLGTPAPAPSNGGSVITEEKLQEMLDKQKEELSEEFEEKLEEAKDEEESLREEREEQRGLSDIAHNLLSEAVRNGFPQAAADDLKVRYSVLPSGPGAGLLVEAEMEGDTVTKSKEDVLKERVKDDVKHVISVIRESGGNVRVKGIDPGSADPEGSTASTGPRAGGAFGTFLRESGDKVDDEETDGKKKTSKKDDEGEEDA
jgi:hypothetical protein